MCNRYPIPQSRHRFETEIQRSRFITTIGYAPTVEEARQFISEISSEFSNASHNCWAYLVGSPGSTSRVGMSDDGEPHGTAGRPMLTVLSHSGIGDIVAVVTRYFGGTLLGKGGLVKAYSGGVQNALESLPVAENVPTALLRITIDYSTVTPFLRMLPDYESEVLDEEYVTDVTYHLAIPVEHMVRFRDDLANLTNGQAVVEVTPAGPQDE